MCILMIELIWVAIYGKREEKPTFWAKFEDLYRYRSERTGTGSALFFCFDQCLYFDHNLLISYPI